MLYGDICREMFSKRPTIENIVSRLYWVGTIELRDKLTVIPDERCDYDYVREKLREFAYEG